MEKIELTEEQFETLTKEIWFNEEDVSIKEGEFYKSTIRMAKEKGYIKQSPVEKAKDRINNYISDGHEQPYIITEAYFIFALKAIAYLEEQLELKKQLKESK